MLYVLVAFLVSLISTLLIVRYRSWHGGLTADHDLDGIQKFHCRPVPRIGGLSLIIAMLVGCALVAFREPDILPSVVLLLACAAPVFMGGFLEDLTKQVRVLVRLGLAMLSGVMAYYLLDGAVTRLDIIGVDWLLTFAPISLLVTAFAIGGAANAINIIDGFNGLAAVVSAMILAGLAYVSFYIGDRFLLVVALTTLGAVLGFLVWNYPRGHVFLGDGGAYFLGFVIGELSVLMLARHPQISAWFPLLLCIYPVFETLFSIYRKRFLRGRSPGAPDGVHLHMLIYKRVVRWAVGSREARHMTQRNSLTSPYLWVLSSLAGIPAVLFWQSPVILMLCTFAFAATYIVLYRRLVLFRMPKWMIVKKKRRH
ncbi:glycosyl transferase [Bordetella genomosp. 5]|uniref:Glycosyl transferase n=1 Tax=Bordetella genomosp. 5 TaxID=1395608 RepID=A0A261U133_9BORD|nr:glycosyltransferase [Bordetella genomosp. 5]OZI33594.1 glycosyl transferase [Bordetella genomosp. 5]OZI54930.1 glycosyl transferase [Bordetella genomosp. 5]